MAKRNTNSRKDRDELMDSLRAAIDRLPDNAYVEIHGMYGLERRGMNDGTVEGRHNGTATYTIRVNGGVQNTEGEPEFYETARQLNRER